MAYKTNTIQKIDVRLLSETSYAGVTGVTSPTVYLIKPDGTKVLKTITSGANWVELDSVNFPGVYRLTLTATDTNQSGTLEISVKDTASDFYLGKEEFQNETNDNIYALLDSVRKYVRNRTKIDVTNKTFTVYADDNTTVLEVYDLRDQSNLPSVNNIYERIPQGTWISP
jgi:hypothetical protein